MAALKLGRWQGKGLLVTRGGCAQTSAVQVFLAVINLILCTQRMPCENSMKTCIGSILAVSILVLEVCPMLLLGSLPELLSAMPSVSCLPWMSPASS